MRVVSLFFLLLLGCTNSSKKDVFEIARHGNIAEMELLIQNNSKIINKKNNSGYTPLILASYYGNGKIVSYLIKKGVNINEISDLGTALMAASYKGQNKIAEILILHGANVNLSDSKKTTALHYACFQQNLALVKLLIAKNANPNKKDTNGKTPLDFAIDNNNIEIIKLLNTH